MAIFDENLKQEEELGFTTNEMDAEDIFYAEKLDKYPGDFPSFDSMPVDNAASQTGALNLDTDNMSENNVDNVQSQSDGALLDNEATFVQSDQSDEALLDNEAVFVQSENIEQSQDIAEQATEQEEAEENILDDELLSMLRQDVKEYQDRKEFQTEITGNDFNDISEKPQVNEQPVFNNEVELDAPQYENTNADIDTPAAEESEQLSYSTMFTKMDSDESVGSSGNEKTDNKKTTATKKAVKKSLGKEKKEKTPLKKIIIGIAIAVILAFIGTFVYYYMQYKKYEEEQKIIAAKIDEKKDTIDVSEAEKASQIKDTIVQTDSTMAQDTTAIEDTTSVQTNLEPEKVAKVDDEKKIEEKSVARQSDQKTEIKQPVAPRKTYRQPKVKSKEIVRRTEQKDRKLVASAVKSSTQAKQEETDAVYVVQIYASPSREDAELRLDILKKKGITGTVTTQKIKDRIWYRVRFGSYSSYQDAQNAAINSGFSQPWVERVK